MKLAWTWNVTLLVAKKWDFVGEGKYADIVGLFSTQSQGLFIPMLIDEYMLCMSHGLAVTTRWPLWRVLPLRAVKNANHVPSVKLLTQ